MGLEFTIVTAPSGRALHVSASLSPAAGSGTWSDSVGNSGALALGANGAGVARPFPRNPTRRYSAFKNAAAAATTTNFDGTFVRTYVLPEPLVTNSVIATADVQVWLELGSINVPLPYTSTAGGAANTIWFKLEPGQIRIYRTTHGCTADATCLVALPSSLT